MGLANTFKKLFFIDEDYDYDIEEDCVASQKTTIPEKKIPEEERKTVVFPRESIKPEERKFFSTTSEDFKLLVIEPKKFEECPKLVDLLKRKRSIVINLENTQTEFARKVFDFLSGATYALDGKVQKVTNNIFIFAPAKVEIATNSVPKKTFVKTKEEDENFLYNKEGIETEDKMFFSNYV